MNYEELRNQLIALGNKVSYETFWIAVNIENAIDERDKRIAKLEAELATYKQTDTEEILKISNDELIEELNNLLKRYGIPLGPTRRDRRP